MLGQTSFLKAAAVAVQTVHPPLQVLIRPHTGVSWAGLRMFALSSTFPRESTLFRLPKIETPAPDPGRAGVSAFMLIAFAAFCEETLEFGFEFLLGAGDRLRVVHASRFVGDAESRSNGSIIAAPTGRFWPVRKRTAAGSPCLGLETAPSCAQDDEK
jgi:hypothetical protein